MHLWQFEVALTPYKNKELLGFRTRNRKEIFDGKMFRFFDISNALAEPEIFSKAQAFVASLGFKFVLPRSPKEAFLFFSLKEIPERWQIEKSDTSLFWANKFVCPNYKTLCEWLISASMAVRHKYESDRKAYANSLLRHFTSNLEKLDEFYEQSSELPPRVRTLVEELTVMGQI